jgi:hypothetical protein
MDRFEPNEKNLSYSLGTNATLIQLQRYFMELVSYGAVIFWFYTLVKLREENLELLFQA